MAHADVKRVVPPTMARVLSVLLLALAPSGALAWDGPASGHAGAFVRDGEASRYAARAYKSARSHRSFHHVTGRSGLDAGYRSYGYRRDRTSPMRVSRTIERRSPSFYYRGTGIFANANAGSFVALPSIFSDPQEPAGLSGPKVIDVASARLDRQPIGPSGISVQRVGLAKIIRIAPGYGHEGERGAEARRDRHPADAGRSLPRPYQPPVRTGARGPSTAVLAADDEAARAAEPWTAEWRRACEARHESFEASRGTYTDEMGRRRFCTGEAE